LSVAESGSSRGRLRGSSTLRLLSVVSSSRHKFLYWPQGDCVLLSTRVLGGMCSLADRSRSDPVDTPYWRAFWHPRDLIKQAWVVDMLANDVTKQVTSTKTVLSSTIRD
jgi:hypothetical protein